MGLRRFWSVCQKKSRGIGVVSLISAIVFSWGGKLRRLAESIYRWEKCPIPNGLEEETPKEAFGHLLF
jgi:hypothetical protein